MTRQLFAFVVMTFAKEFEDKYILAIKSAAEDAGMRVERLKDHIFHCQGMVERIHQQIEEADFIIGDMTSSNPNVFYEVGYAQGKNKLCILLTDDPAKLPFDLKYRRWMRQGELNCRSHAHTERDARRRELPVAINMPFDTRIRRRNSGRSSI